METNAFGDNAGDGKEPDALGRRLRDMNEALLVSSIHQHELTERAQESEAALRKSETELRSRGEELTRFNRAAVGREARMIELKRQFNASSQRHGEVAPFPLDLKYEEMAGHATLSAGAASKAKAETFSQEGIASIESILHTEELSRRPSRPPDYETENRALASLVQALSESAGAILHVLAEKILDVLRADSAGISLLTPSGDRFYWPAIAGVWQSHVGGGTPRSFGPCGDVLDRNSPLLFQHVERRYTYFQPVSPLVEEALLIPFYVDGNPVGTLWAISHGEHRFDAEDLRQLESLGRFASAAYQAVGAKEFERSRSAAALNLMEDAVDSRDAIERVNAQLRASEERYRTLFTSMDEGFCIIEVLLDPDGKAADYRFLETNPGFEKHTGLHQVAGKLMRDLRPEHEAHWFEKYGEVARTGESARFVSEARELNGRWFDVHAFRLGEPESRRVAILFTDISERVRLEATTKEYATSLADLNRRKDEFLAMLSHELRNPLASIVNATHLLRLQGDRNPLQIEAHGMIERQVAQLARLVDDLLEVSRISTGRIRLNLERMDFRETIRRALESTKAQANRKGQSISISLPPEPLWVNGDSVRLEQVVVNILNNAVKYTDHGGDIRVSASAEANAAVLRVRDNGVGIATDMIPHIFELFAQADRSLDHSQGGLGIGLALVQSLVTMHRGRVEVESVLGEGSVFLIKLPIDEAPQVSVHCAVESVSKKFQGLKVLVVDDNVDAAQSLAMLLQAMGQGTKIAHDGGRAIELALEWVPDVLLLDIGLPKTNGFQVASRIRQEPTLADVMLVALTGYGQDADRQRSKEAGFHHHLTKPVEFSAIEKILSSICARKLAPSGAVLPDMRIN